MLKNVNKNLIIWQGYIDDLLGKISEIFKNVAHRYWMFAKNVQKCKK